jgi:hypothetical protein
MSIKIFNKQLGLLACLSILGSVVLATLGFNLLVNAQVTANRGLIVSPAIIELEGDRGGAIA